MGKISLRSCIACRQKVEKRELIRFVAVDQALVPDLKSNMPGRGAYLHRKSDCILKAIKGGRWERALRVEQKLSTQKLMEMVAEFI